MEVGESCENQEMKEGEEEDPFAIIPDNYSTSCLLCDDESGSGTSSSSSLKEIGIGMNIIFLRKFMGLTHLEEESVDNAVYCPTCQKFVDKVCQVVKKIEELEGQLGELRTELRNKLGNVLEKDGRNNDGVHEVRKVIAEALSVTVKTEEIEMNESVDDTTYCPSSDEDQVPSSLEQLDMEHMILEVKSEDDTIDTHVDSEAETTNVRYSLRRRGAPITYKTWKPIKKKETIAKLEDEEEEPKKVDKPFSCTICTRRFEKEAYQKAHIRRVHYRDKTPFHCEYPGCGEHFNSLRKLVSHQRRTHKDLGLDPVEKKFTCELCGKLFVRKQSLEGHMAYFHIEGGRKYICDVCGYGCPYPEGLKRHMITHADEKPYPCGHCNKGFLEKKYLEEHVNVHHLNIRYNCTECPKNFATKQSLREHQKINHMKELPFECTQCGRRVVSETKLKVHMQIHLPKEQRKFACRYCDARFYLVTLLKQHMLRHEGINPFKCDQCGKGFVAGHILRRHIQQIHVNGAKPHPRKTSLVRVTPQESDQGSSSSVTYD